jgi:DNA-binding NtrC family response regulator
MKQPSSSAKSSSLREAVRGTEEQLIRDTIDKNHWQMSRVANELQISRSTLYNRLKRYGIKR